MRALVLSGGGALGAYEAGVICGLAERENFDLVCGASIGSLNGALYAQDRCDALERFWRTLSARQLVKLQPRVEVLRSLVETLIGLARDGALAIPRHVIEAAREFGEVGPLETLQRLTGAYDAAPIVALLEELIDFAALKRSLVVRATNLTRARADLFYYFAPAGGANVAGFLAAEPSAHAFTAENFRDAVRASAALPGALEPVSVATEAGTDRFVDGGVAGTTPVGQAIEAGAGHVTVVFVDPATEARMPSDNLVQIAWTSLGVTQQRLLALDLRAAEAVNAHVAKGWTDGKKRHVDLRTIRPADDLGLSLLDFGNQSAVDAAFERGMADGRSAS
ncbi:MAG TPA: patatin-like phospholipase family protein [Candidatus Baltobacteraceae bacterium]|nr:patatin-like phospholipase family protein [Candidatus Baltobacteraceae bacterium]